ncbi:flavin reductase family protein [Actinacidiphila acidipaludis]|uniref:Flavin reductase family protein n=1 Tax=Actinacidiphila acidipaludis TaxID=2873382 RepID=A0ABS7Q3Y2_9ACTN|nr:flavin reductase family protein [Streptomyces acidipaludis]MBY8877414.1 flavin reductase family protein [Streptomyces acidipaludis]
MTDVERTHQVPDRAPAVDFRDFMSTFCTGVAVITAFDDSGRPHGLTCTSLASVTLEPPTLLVCLHVATGTLGAVLERGAFLVNLMDETGKAAAQTFASRTPDRFDRVAWRPAARSGQPWLFEDAFAAADCEVTRTTPVGDHVAVFGRVVEVTSRPGNPLLYGMRQFSGWTDDRSPVS